MRSNFDRALLLVLKHEGGYSNHPKDPGGATNRGVTQMTYDNWRKDQHQPVRSVKEITDAEIAALYRSRYWNAVRGDDLPAGVDYAVFDYAVNSGPGRAVRELQKAVGAVADGIIGPATLALAAADQPKHLIADICQRRLAFMRQLSTWSTFGKGWQARVDGVLASALAMAASAEPVQAPPAAPASPPVHDAIPPPEPPLRQQSFPWGTLTLIVLSTLAVFVFVLIVAARSIP